LLETYLLPFAGGTKMEFNTIIGIIGLIVVPLAIFIGFVVCLIMFIRCPKEQIQRRQGWKIGLIVTGTISLCLLIVAGFILFLLYLVMANM